MGAREQRHRGCEGCRWEHLQGAGLSSGQTHCSVPRTRGTTSKPGVLEASVVNQS